VSERRDVAPREHPKLIRSLTQLLIMRYSSGMKKQQKVSVSERALLQRTNRKLKAKDQRVCIARGFWADGFYHEDTNLGRFYTVDVHRNAVVDTHVDLEQLAREAGALKPWEELVR
jgi:hypothetical protein